MVNSERDHYDRIYGYFLRLKDGGPILIPEDEGLPLRHVYGEDVTHAIARISADDRRKGRAYNLSQEETISLPEFLEMLSGLGRLPLRIVRVPRERLERERLLPDCSPFSGRWMSALDNRRSKEELGIAYTPLRTYLKNLVRHFEAPPLREIEGYKQRARELDLAKFRK